MIILKTSEEIQKMKKSGELLAKVHKEIAKIIKPGISTMEIDKFVEDYLKEHNAYPEQRGYHGYPYAICASINDEICHGYPRTEPLKEGDIVTIDMVVNIDGWLADSAWSYAVGNISDEARRLLDITKEALYKGIEKATIGNRLGDIGYAIQSFAESNGYSVVRDFVGHGIGKEMHEDPQVPHYGIPGRGQRLVEGMVITIEPMINVGTYRMKIDDNEWTARTVDGKLSAQYEHTIAITKEGPMILTDQDQCN
ncbi:type I methionyl aminopeptidase [Tissierella praeacuta]|uniref:Methionine aminopeptidase n=1 Tax=Tissierella praeacuta DSM 18095 TaxID=1123404 RepID=A0A1M4W208_9FIRM|nr:type I methionyl aminopeptidase [Tissierella praeacuta]MBU5256208.1 type I methionyl aminopeptidase [Tissierella praeacuta]TCU75665.1 methionyl aminopeptidase [Tissierella praeacuta]SHE75268.1 methionyl aminopeptidase [Tissierella praeacuta DSM 18095]SUP00189.1 Methionine aminopeptidase 1 [Tissierella praeacuta]